MKDLPRATSDNLIVYRWPGGQATLSECTPPPLLRPAFSPFVGQDVVLGLYDGISRLPAASREALELNSDNHGAPPLHADHRAPLAIDADFDSGGTVALLPGRRTLRPDGFGGDVGEVNALDYYGYWKWLDALTDAAFYGTHRIWARQHARADIYGTWADGQRVAPAARVRPIPDAPN